jgi:hypothetical protein
MTSFSIAAAAAAAPLLMALVPCVFASVKAPETSITLLAADASEDARVEDRTPWWKPSALGIDNYS